MNKTSKTIYLCCILLAFVGGYIAHGETPQEELQRQLDLSSQAVERAHQIASKYRLHLNPAAKKKVRSVLSSQDAVLQSPDVPKRIRPLDVSRRMKDGSARQ